MKRILSILMVALLLVSAIPTAYATTDYTNGTQVEYDANDRDGDGQMDNLGYTITVPAKLAPGGSGTVTLEGMWPSNATVKVTADKSVDLVNSINAADTKNLIVTFAGIEKAGNNTERKTYTETVSVADISAALFGTWEGVFYYNVDYVEPVEVLKGDANNDGVLTMHDKDYVLTLVASNFNGLSDEEMAGLIARADMDGDGSVGAKDAAAIGTLVTNSGWVAPYVNPHTYNSVELPGLPEWDKATYPYAVITEGDEYAPYYLNLYTHAVKHDDNKLSSNESGAKVLYGDIDDYGEWNLQPRAVAVTEQSTIDYPIVWTNTDILNTDGSVYMAASDPVPVS